MRLTGMEPLGDSGAYVLHFEDSTHLRCSDRELITYHLRAGMELDGEHYTQLLADCRLFAVRQKAAQLLSQRPLSAGELKQKLLEKGAEPEHAEKAVSRLVELGVLDEEAYAAMVVRHYAAKGYGKLRIQQELFRHKVPRELWSAALDAVPDGGEALQTLIDRKLRGQSADPDTLRKLSAALCRKGYGWQAVQEALRQYEKDHDFPDNEE